MCGERDKEFVVVLVGHRFIFSVSERSEGRLQTMYLTASTYMSRAVLSDVLMSSRFRAAVARLTPARAVSQSIEHFVSCFPCRDLGCEMLGTGSTRDRPAM